MARVWKMKSGKWICEIRKKGHPYISKAFWDLKVARKFGRDVESKMERNVFEDYSGARGTTLREILVRYRDERTVLKKGWREETNTINKLIGHKIALNSLMMLKSHHIHKLMKELSSGRKPSTVNKYVNLICHAWRVAKREWGINLPAENPCDMVTLNKFDDTRDRVLTKTEYHQLLEVALVQDSAVNNSGNNTVDKDRYRHLTDVIKFAYQTGARQGEILKLKREHIDFDARTCTFYDTKNKADRTIPLADETLAIVKKHVFGQFIFDVDSRRLRKWFNKATRTAKISNFRFHDLRACFCTNALLNGWSIGEVSAISGHKDWSQLKRYTRIKPADLLEKINNVVNLK
jgi:integrase